MKNYSTEKRDENVKNLIKNMEVQTTFEGLYSVLNDTPYEDRRIGQRVWECGEVFLKKLVEVSKTEDEVSIAILSLRGGWSWDRRCDEFSRSTESVYWSVIKHLKDYLNTTISGKVSRYSDEYEQFCKEAQSVVERYSHRINSTKESSDKATVKLAKKLKTYKKCQLIFSRSQNYPANVVLLRQMCKTAKTHAELLYCIKSILCRKSYISELRPELKKAIEMLQQLI